MGKAIRKLGAKDDLGSPPLSELVYQRIKKEIDDGILVPGQRVFEGTLAERYKVSRTPTRETLKRLISEGLFVMDGNRGVVVRKLSSQEMFELYAMREVLEGTAARFAAESASDWEIQNLKSILGQLKDMPANITARDAARWNREFHRAIYDAAQNGFLLAALESLHNAMSILGPTTFSAEGRPATAYVEHAAIVDAIAAGDGDKAEKAAREHIREAYRYRLLVLQETRARRAPE